MNDEAEKRVIGALLMRPDVMDLIADVLEPDMFNGELFGKAYHEFQKAYDQHEELNYPGLLSRLMDAGYSEYQLTCEFKDAITSTTTTADVELNARIIKNDFVRKQANILLNSTQFSSSEIETQIHETIGRLEKLLTNNNSTSYSLAEITGMFKDRYFKLDDTVKLGLGFDRLDDTIGGLEGGDVFVIGARPAVGKSAFVTQVAMHLAKLGKRVGFYNLEMKEQQMFERFVVSSSRIGLTRLKRATRYLGTEEQAYSNAIDKLSKINNLIISTGAKSISQIRSESRHMDYDIIIIDYLQLVIADKQYRGNRYAEVGAISKAVKALAMELNIPIIALTQLNRVSEGKETKEPTMAEIRESGDIEQDASVICLLWNIDSNNRKWKGCKIDKNRQGECKTEVLAFDGDLMQFKETDMRLSDFQEKQGKMYSRSDDDIPDFF